MLHILLVILKIIGILFAILIGLILLCILLVLLCPACYQINGEYRRELKFQTRITFLRPLMSVVVEYSDGLNVVVRILGFRIIPKNQKEKPSTRKKDRPSDKNRKKQTSTVDLIDEQNIDSNTNIDSNRNTNNDQNEDSIQNTGHQQNIGHNQDEKKWKNISPYLRIKRKIIHIKEAVIDFFRFIIQLFRIVGKSVSDFSAFFSSFTELLDDEGIKMGWTVLLEETLFLLKKGQPKKYRWFLKFGTGDPCLTGQILGWFGIVYAMWGKGMQLEPDFENTVFETEFFCKGKIRGIHVLRFILKIMLNKDFKYLKEQVLNLRRS